VSAAESDSGLDYGQVPVVNTRLPTLIVPSDGDREWLVLEVLGTVDVAVGDRGVTYTSGFRLRPDRLYLFETTAALYGITGQNRPNAGAARAAVVQYLAGNQ
jgi:hypothetical protein